MQEHTISKEQWINWEPAQPFEDKYFIDFVNVAPFQLTIQLRKKNKCVQLVFKSEVIHYKRNDEVFCVQLCIFLSNINLDFAQKTFFIINNSSYSAKLQTSRALPASTDLIHFCLLADDSVIDILVTNEPEIIITN